MENLSDLKTPRTRNLVLANGQVAILGTITFGVMLALEERYGQFDEWQKKVMGSGGVGEQIKASGSMFWAICLNKDEIAPDDMSDEQRERKFLDLMPLANMVEVGQYVNEIISEAMPTQKASTGKGKTTGKKSNGSITS